MPPHREEHTGARGIGQRIQAIRKHRGLTQSGLAQRAHVSYSTITKIESGHLPASPTVTAACARALRVPITDLTGQPYVTELRSDRLEELVQPIRVAIANPLHVVNPDVAPRALVRIAAEVEEAERVRVKGHAEIGSRVPALIDELIHAAHVAPAGRQRERSYWLLASVYRLAHTFLHKIGYTDLGMMALDRLETAASRSGDPCLAGTVAACRSVYFLQNSAYDVGLAEVRGVQDALEDDARRGDLHARYMMGHMHLKAAVFHSRKQAPSGAAAAMHHIQEAGELSRQLPRGFDPYGQIFDRTNVELHNVSVRIDLAELGTAVERGESIQFPEGWARHRESHHRMDMARAYERLGRKDDAFRSLVDARRVDPTQTRYHPTTRETVLALLRKRGTPPRELSSYARWVGL